MWAGTTSFGDVYTDRQIIKSNRKKQFLESTFFIKHILYNVVVLFCLNTTVERLSSF